MRQASKDTTIRASGWGLAVSALLYVAAAHASWHPVYRRRRISSSPSIQVLKLDSKAASGACMIKPIHTLSEAKNIIREYNIEPTGFHNSELIALANGLAQATALNGGVFAPMTNADLNMHSTHGYSEQQGVWRDKNGQVRGHIKLNRCLSNGRHCGDDNAAHFMHELGHQVGNANGARLYQKFEEATRGCHPTRYSEHNLHEQFAEDFSAFLTRPELLYNSTRNCMSAWRFFAYEVFKNHGPLASCEASKKSELLALYEGHDEPPAPQQVASVESEPSTSAAPLANTSFLDSSLAPTHARQVEDFNLFQNSVLLSLTPATR